MGGELSVSVPRLPRLLPGLLWLLLLLAGLPLPENNTASCLTSPGLTGRIGLRELRHQPVDLVVNPRRHVPDPVRFSLHVVDARDSVRGDGVVPHAASCVRRADAALEYASEAALAYIRRGLREMWRPEHSDSFQCRGRESRGRMEHGRLDGEIRG